MGAFALTPPLFWHVQNESVAAIAHSTTEQDEKILESGLRLGWWINPQKHTA